MKKIFSFVLTILFVFAAQAVSLDEILKLDAEATLKNFPDARTILLYDDQQVTFELDGTANDIDDMYYKMLTDKGVREYRSMPMHFNEFYSKYHIEALEIIRGGKVIPIDIKANTRISVDNSQMSANIYDPHDKILSINIPSLQVNDILHLKVRRETLRPRMKGFFTDIAVLRSDSPIFYYRLSYNAPEKMPLKSILVKDEVKGTLTRTEKFENGRFIYTFEAKNVPQMIPEPDAPPLFLYCQRVLVSSAEKWEDISKWYFNLCEPHIQAVTPEMKKFTAELVKNCKTPAEKLRKIFDFVSQDIRYMGVTTETEAPGYEPHDVNITFEKRYGVCRDKAALLVAMLRLADIPAYMTLFYAGSPKDPEVANNYFNHAVVAAQYKGTSDYILMDPTDENSSELLPAYGSNKSYLVSRKEGDTLRLSPEIAPEKNSLDIINNWQIDADNNLSGTTEIIFNGINDNIYRDAFASWSNDESKNFFKTLFGRVLPGCEISKSVIYPSNIRDLRQILRVKVDLSVKNFVNSSGGISALPPHRIGSVFGALALQMNKISLAKRLHPLQFYSTASVNEKTTLKFIGTAVDLEIPEFKNAADSLFSHSVSAGFKDNTLLEKSSMSLAKTLISADEYIALKDSVRKADAENRRKIFIIPASVAENAENTLIELSRREIDFRDARNWTDTFSVRKKILDYSGVKSNAELIVSFDSGRENASLVSAQVTTPDGKIHKVDQTEVHIMDSGNTANSPCYAQSKLLTVKFPHIVPGSVIDYKYKVEHKEMPFFNDTFVFASDTDTVLREIILRNIPPMLKMSAVPANVEKISDGKNITLRKREIQRITAEHRQPPSAMFADTVFASTVNFQEYCFVLSNLLNKAAANSPAAAAKAKELTSECKDIQAKITAIRDFIDRNIRLAGPALNAYGWKFSPADETLKRSYGNSADRAVLFKAMLDSIGIENEFAVRSGIGMPRIMNDYFTNSLRYFQDIYDRVLLHVYDNEKLIAVLNENSRYAPIDQDNSYSETGLLLKKRIPIPRSSQILERTVRKINYKITPDLQTSAELEYTYYGPAAESMRRFFAESDSAQKRQFFERSTLAFSRQATVVKDWESINAADRFTLKCTLLLRDHISKTGKYAALPLAIADNFASSVPDGTADRKIPLWQNHNQSSVLFISVELPENYIPANPMIDVIERNFDNIFTFDFSMSQKENKIFIASSLISRIGLMQKENCAVLPQLKKLINSSELNTIFLKKK